jgi:hypothetical protein
MYTPRPVLWANTTFSINTKANKFLLDNLFDSSILVMSWFFTKKGCVKAKIDICTLLICAEGTKTPAGGRGRGDPTGAKAPRRLPGPPAESEVPGGQINRTLFNTAHDNYFKDSGER